MHVDHFNPTIKGKKRNHFTNLMLASAHCNLRKSNRWPSAREELEGLRLLNCTEEQYYGQHIYEDLKTGKLYGSTPAGRFHIERLDLNGPYLCYKRKQRTRLRALWNARFIKLPIEDILPQIQAFGELIDNFIPEIAPWSGDLDPT
jgi:hypothetical protein